MCLSAAAAQRTGLPREASLTPGCAAQAPAWRQRPAGGRDQADQANRRPEAGDVRCVGALPPPPLLRPPAACPGAHASQDRTEAPRRAAAAERAARAGLRKKTREFMGENYLANFVQSTFNSLHATGAAVKGGTLVISGDGRCARPPSPPPRGRFRAQRRLAERAAGRADTTTRTRSRSLPRWRWRRGSSASGSPPPLPTFAPTGVPTVHSLPRTPCRSGSTGCYPRRPRPQSSARARAASSPSAPSSSLPRTTPAGSTRTLGPPPHPTPLVLSGHAASLTPY